MTDSTPPSEAKAFDLLIAGKVAAALAAIPANADPQATLDLLAAFSQRAYRDLKNLPAMIAMAWAAVRLAEAVPASPVKARVRTIAYNAAANCWPGWGDAVDITPGDIAEGLKLAQHSQQFVQDLGLGGKETGTALWLVGALQLAAGDPAAATSQFLRAAEAFRSVPLPAQAAMAQGYAALAEKALPAAHPTAADRLRAIILALRALNSDEAHFFADQLITADRIFHP